MAEHQKGFAEQGQPLAAPLQQKVELGAGGRLVIPAPMRAALDEGVREMVVDLSGVHMVDSSGIGLLISAHNSLCKVGGRLAVIHASDDILDLFKTLRMHQHFSVSGGAEAER